jgi:hypothetical protein
MLYCFTFSPVVDARLRSMQRARQRCRASVFFIYIFSFYIFFLYFFFYSADAPRPFDLNKSVRSRKNL